MEDLARASGLEVLLKWKGFGVLAMGSCFLYFPFRAKVGDSRNGIKLRGQSFNLGRSSNNNNKTENRGVSESRLS